MKPLSHDEKEWRQSATLAIFITLAGVITWMTNPTLLTRISIGAITTSLAVIATKKTWRFGNQPAPWPLFLPFFFIYCSFLPFLYALGFSFSYPGLETEDSSIHSAYEICSWSIIILSAISIFEPTLSKKNNTPSGATNTPSYPKTAAASYLLLAISSGLFLPAFRTASANGMGRLGAAQELGLVVWLQFGWAFILLFFLALEAHRKSAATPRQFTILLLPTIGYVIMDAMLGGRKILAALYLGAIYYQRRYGSFPAKWLLAPFPIILFLMSIRALVYDQVTSDSTDFTSSLFAVGGEFVFTFATLPTTIANQCSYYSSDLSSYLLSILQFIPRSIWPDKPYSLAYSLSDHLYGGTEGFAINPIAEAWCSFKWGASIAFPAIMVAISLIARKASERAPVVGFLFFAHLLDINRGEISYLVFQLLTLSMAHALMSRILEAR